VHFRQLMHYHDHYRSISCTIVTYDVYRLR
jgi:hypothetical protein